MNDGLPIRWARPHGSEGSQILCASCLQARATYRTPVTWLHHLLVGDCEGCGAREVRTYSVQGIGLARVGESLTVA